MHEFANEGIDLPQTELGSTLQIAAHETVFAHSHLQGCGTGIFRSCRTVLFDQGEKALHAAHAQLPLVLINVMAEGSDLSARVFGPHQQLRNLPRSSWREIPLLDAMPAAFLTDVLAQQLPGFRIEEPDEDLLPLHSDHASDPARR